MSNKTKLLLLVLLVVIVAGLFWYRNQVVKQNAKNAQTTKSATVAGSDQDSDEAAMADASADSADLDFNARCESGEWVKIADVEGDTTSATGTLHWVDVDNDAASKQFENYSHYLDSQEKIGLVNPAVKSDADTNDLDLFQGRVVEVQGVAKKAAVREIQVSQVRCTGVETDKNVAGNRVKMLNYISANISAIAPEKAPQEKWVADSAIILDEKDVYVDYYDTIQDSDNADPNLDTMHRVLLEMTAGDGGNYSAKVLAYYVPGEDDFTLQSGTDKFKSQDETAFPSYIYDPDDNSWTRD